MKKLSENKGVEIGKVFNVDTGKLLLNVDNEESLNSLRINDLLLFNGSNNDEMLVGMITRINKKLINILEDETEGDMDTGSENYCIAVLIGTYYDKLGTETSIFKRIVNTYPEINSNVYHADENSIEIIMSSLSSAGATSQFEIGRYVINKDVSAILDGNKFFQRHACIVGSTGSGKSFTVANMMEKINGLNYSNVILFDLHGEYNELPYCKQIKIGSDKDDLKMPLWFFTYEEIQSLFIESTEGTSTNQRAVVIEFILREKKEYIKKNKLKYEESIITADTTIPFNVKDLFEYLEEKNTEMIDTGEVYKTGDKKGQIKTRQGTYYDKLTNLINRLKTKMDDSKYSFIFDDSTCSQNTYLNKYVNRILSFDDENIKVIDLSEVPSDILPIIIGTLTRIIYDIQFWMTPKKNEVRHPLVFVCDEAHIYMPNDSSKLRSVEKKSLEIFEKIAKEGRKYGIGLLVVSQRPSELNSTIFSQCNNIMSLKVTNDRDKSAVSSMLNESLTGLVDMLPNLDTGECIVVGDSILLPTKIILNKPEYEPKSATIPFWDKWNNRSGTIFDIDKAVDSMINQKR